MSESIKSIKTQNRSIAVVTIFLVILALGFLGWYSYLYFRPAFAPMGATSEYTGTQEASSLKATEYSGGEISDKFALKGQRSDFQTWSTPFSFVTEFHYEVLLSVPSDIVYFTVTNLTIRLAYGTTSSPSSSSESSSNSTSADEGKSVFVERGHIDFVFEGGEAKFTSVYASRDTDNMGVPLTEPYPGNSTQVSILEGSVLTAYSAE